MAAFSTSFAGTLVDFGDLRAEHLEHLLAAERDEWRRELLWDFEPSAALLRHFLDLRALSGFALRGTDGRLYGYCYHVVDENKGLLGDVFLLPEYRTEANESLLLKASLDALWRDPSLDRVEAQLLLLDKPFERVMPYQSRMQTYARQYLMIELEQHLDGLPEHSTNLRFIPWTDTARAAAARVLIASYRDHVDSRLNDHYLKPAGATRFLTNLIEYPGCGLFNAPASLLANDGSTLAGVIMASTISPGVGHITQTCVATSHRNQGVGYELLRRSLLLLRAQGCHKVTLAVTTENTDALALYQRMGFRLHREFAAQVWQLR
jgi:ribosomal protein S18 acetylase RimI-like enzyme